MQVALQTSPPALVTQSGPPTVDSKVADAWHTRALTDGTRLHLGHTDDEQGFIVRDSGVFSVEPRERGTMYCADRSERRYAKFEVGDFASGSAGHTHPEGRTGTINPLPGPEDGATARRTGHPAYVLSTRGAFKIEDTASGFHISQLAGKSLSAAERGEIERTVSSYDAHQGGSGVKCTFQPDH